MGLEIRLEQVAHEYGRDAATARVRALVDVNLRIGGGDFVVIMGESGSGKSTLLNLIGAVDRPTSGKIWLGPTEISFLSERQLTALRRTGIGFIFQFFNLIPTLTVRENVAFPLSLAGVSAREAGVKADQTLESVGLLPRAHHFPNELSGGEMQRVAIGRAVVHRPPVVLADEPTGNLDSTTGDLILKLMRSVHDSYAPTIVMATHSEHAASFGQYVVEVRDGVVTRRTAHS